MSEYLVEVFQPGTRPLDTARPRRAAEELARKGTAVRYVRAIYVPDDEICLHLFEAPSAGAVAAAAERAELLADRIVEVVA